MPPGSCRSTLARTLPGTQHAVQIVGPGQLVHNRAKPVFVPGPTQLVLRVEAVGICFSDTKLLHAFTAHLRKAEVSDGLDSAALAEIPSYVPGELPTVPGHEVAGRIVASERPSPATRWGSASSSRQTTGTSRPPAPTRRSATTSRAASRSTSCSTSG